MCILAVHTYKLYRVYPHLALNHYNRTSHLVLAGRRLTGSTIRRNNTLIRISPLDLSHPLTFPPPQFAIRTQRPHSIYIILLRNCRLSNQIPFPLFRTWLSPCSSFIRESMI
jgi:hypothetical protein